MRPVTFLVFGDLHGRVLPAFRLAQAWSLEHGVALDGLLQVGDLGDSRIDRAAWRHPGRNALAGRMQPAARPDDATGDVDRPLPGPMWFSPGNHDDCEALRRRERGVGRGADGFVVDADGRVCCIRDGHVAELPGGLRVGALWGIDDRAPRARGGIPPAARIRRRAAEALALATFDVLLTHDSPRDAVLADNGSEAIGSLIRAARPAFAFFGHYHRTGRRVEGDFGRTRVYHLGHLELRSRAEEGSVGVLRWGDGVGEFDYLDPDWLRTVTRHNWRHR